MTIPNTEQVGGTHYKSSEVACPNCGHRIQHWDIAWGLDFDPFQYIISKWLFRWRDKGGIEDLKKIRHAVDKYISVVECGMSPRQRPPEPKPKHPYENIERDEILRNGAM